MKLTQKEADTLRNDLIAANPQGKARWLSMDETDGKIELPEIAINDWAFVRIVQLRIETADREAFEEWIKTIPGATSENIGAFLSRDGNDEYILIDVRKDYQVWKAACEYRTAALAKEMEAVMINNSNIADAEDEKVYDAIREASKPDALDALPRRIGESTLKYLLAAESAGGPYTAVSNRNGWYVVDKALNHVLHAIETDEDVYVSESVAKEVAAGWNRL